MANIRPEQVSHSANADDQSKANKTAADGAGNVPALKIVVMDIADTTRTLVEAVQRLEGLLSDLTRRG